MSRNFLKFFFNILLFIILALPLNSWAAVNDFASKNENAEVRLIASYETAQSEKQKLLLGIHFKLKNGWKIYGKSDSSFVQEPIFDFTKSTNIDSQNFNVIWPEAKIIQEKILDETISYPVYENEIVIPIKLDVVDASKPTTINANIIYALCNEVCIPVEQNFQLTIKAGEIDQVALDLAQMSIIKSEEPIKNVKITLISAIIFSFLGGLILNIMPCVLPVLSIKLLSIIKHSKSSLKKIRFAFISTILGILFCFLLFAVIISSLKMLGSGIGWGSQFQSPYFLIFLVIILTIFVANLFGLFEIHVDSFLSNVINRKIKENEKEKDAIHVFVTNFLSGILAVLLATPCSAPFLGTAISFAFLQDSLIIFTIFTFMALGLAFPYFVLIAFPKAVTLLPKPGNWMNNVKTTMAGFLVATIIWLIFILSHNIGFIASMMVAIFSTLIFLCFKLCKKYKVSRPMELLIILLVSAAIIIVPIQASKHFMSKERAYNGLWVKFDEDKIKEHIDKGEVVVIDITADWCITCKLNKRAVLDSKEVIAKLKEPKTFAMRGDLTKPDRKIFDFMASHDRYAIPFNIVYGPNAPEGILLSELLNKKLLIKAIDSAR